MSEEESTTPDPVELTRRVVEIGNRRDLDATMAFYAPDAVFDMSDGGLGIYEGASAIRGFCEDWLGNYDEFRIEAEEILDLGNGVVSLRSARMPVPLAAVATDTVATERSA